MIRMVKLSVLSINLCMFHIYAKPPVLLTDASEAQRNKFNITIKAINLPKKTIHKKRTLPEWKPDSLRKLHSL